MSASNVSDLAKPLYKLYDHKSGFLWNNEAQNSFEMIKKVCSEKLELNLPDLSKDFILEKVASDIGSRAVLKQISKPITYVSRLLKGAE